MKISKAFFRPRWLSLVLLALACTGCGRGAPTLHSVRGSILVNGKPAERVVVSFLNVNREVKGNTAHPCAVTDANGKFLLSTESDSDGAAVGEYHVTFIWWSDPDPDKARDLLGGVYGDSKRFTLKVKIQEGDNELRPFELKTDVNQEKKFVK